MNRRGLLAGAIGMAVPGTAAAVGSRVRSADPAWPSADAWAQLNRAVDGHLIKVAVPALTAEAVRNPYFLGDQLALTQTSGWADAWRSAPSVYAVAAQTAL